MEQLDRAIATAYVQNYPKEAKRIHMGKNDDVIESESEHGGIQVKPSCQSTLVRSVGP